MTTYQLAKASTIMGRKLTSKPASRGKVRANQMQTAGGAWVLTTGNKAEYTLEVDQIVGSKREADKELKDLKAMGFDDAKAKAFATWAEAEAWADKAKGY